MLRFMYVCASIGAITSGTDASVVIDGATTPGEWRDAVSIARDDDDAITLDFEPLELSILSAGTRLYALLRTAGEGNIVNASWEGDLALTVWSDASPPQALLTVRYGESQVFAGELGGTVIEGDGSVGPSLDIQVLPTVAADLFEFGIELGPLGVRAGDGISVSAMLLEDDGTPVVSLGPSHVLLLDAPGAMAPVTSTGRACGTDVRIAAYNIVNGLDPAEARQLVGVKPDIILLSETGPANDAVAILNALEPGEPAWVPFGQGSDVIVLARMPGRFLFTNESDYTGVLVQAGEGRSVLAVSAHPACCGIAGGLQDLARINAAYALVAKIAQLRAKGTIGDDVPVIVGGDYNLVGSITPLTILEDELGLHAPALVKVNGDTATTWRGGGFPPLFFDGRLDLVGWDSGMVMKGGFVLDTALLTPTQLQDLGVQANDSAASDHLLLVVDLALPVIGDLNADGVVDADDLGVLLGAFGSSKDGDLNGNGITDADDLGILLGAFGSGC